MLRLPHNSHRAAQRRPAATKRAAAPSGGSLYCACHTKARRTPAAPSGDQARRSSSRRLSVLRLPHKSHRAAQRRPAATKRAEAPSGGSLYCACHAKASARPSGAQRRPSAQQLLQEALCTALATQKPPRGRAAPSGDQARSSSSRRLSVLRLPHSSEARPSGAPRRPHAQQLLQKALCTAPATQQRSAAQRRPAATKRAAAPPEGSLYCACHTESEAGSGDEARRNSSRRLSVLRLPRKSHRTAQRRPAATKRAAAPSGGSLYCACHAKATARPSGAQRRPSAQQLLQEALCTAPATQKPPSGPAAPSGDQARRSSFRRLSVLRLPRKNHRAAQRRPSAQQLLQEALCTAPATQKQPRGPAAPSGDQARSSSVRRLSVLRLPRKSQRAEAPPGGSLYCACHTTATERPSGAQRRPSAQQLLQEALCTAPATQKQGAPQRRPAATKRAEAPPGGSLYCACHTKATERPSGAQRRPSAQKLLQEALCTAPAMQKPPRGPAAPSGAQARSSSFRRLSVLRLPRKSQRAAQRRPAATKRAAAPSGGSLYCACHAKAPRDEWCVMSGV